MVQDIEAARHFSVGRRSPDRAPFLHPRRAALHIANRLISTTLSGVNTQFGYNGDGIRLQLLETGASTTYTQDYAAPLPVVLQARTESAATQYVYTLGTRPLAEYEAAAWEYLLPDALGSVRQIANSSSDVTLLKSYEPYGSVLNNQGTATSVFAYAGEQVDAYTKLVFLRARYYSPDTARFLSRDLWPGEDTRPQSLNGWGYVEDNPVNYADPSGHCPEGDTACEAVANSIEDWYKVTIDRGTDRCEIDIHILLHARGLAINWSTEELRTLEPALGLTRAFLDNTHHPFVGSIGDRGYVIQRVVVPSSGPINIKTFQDTAGRVWTEVPDNVFARGTMQPESMAAFIHEFFHAFDYYSRHWVYDTFPGGHYELVSDDPVFSSDKSLKRGHAPRPSNHPDCGPTNYACADQYENFADSAAVYALTWLTQNYDPTGFAELVSNVYGDAGANRPGNPYGERARPVSKWDDNGLRKNFLDRFFGVTVR